MSFAGAPLPPASLRLLVSPVRLMSAFIWRVVQQHRVMQYDELVDFISLATDVVPELLSPSQRAQLTLGLRARLVLELCRGDGVANLQTIQSHLDKIHACSAELSSTGQMVGFFFKENTIRDVLIEVFPINYGSNYDQRLQQLVCEFLSRLEQLLPTPDQQQTAAWLTETTCGSEEFGQNLSEPFALKSLLLHHRQLGNLSTCTLNRNKHDSGVEKKRERKQKKDNLENKARPRRKEPTGEDKRFLSTRHINKKFTEKETKCLKCKKVFELPNQLKAHMKLHSFPYCCNQCEKGFTSPSGYYQHQRLHKKGRIFVCSQCNKGFLCNYSLKQHVRLHGGPTHLCNICGKSFSKAGITRHMQMHKGEKNYLCTTCGKSFLSSGELLLHVRSHTGEMPYTCTHCGKGFSTKSHLNVHTRSHTGERPYLCSACPKRFLTVNCLKRHTLSHNGVKPFKCPNCEKKFSQQGNLKRHLATHKPDT
uniref:C2H2-type domain-containing protein n=1 Tax=Cyclopterus lumpus TaxID=8103 RepID=A0A8C2ZCA0_CYCLU